MNEGTSVSRRRFIRDLTVIGAAVVAAPVLTSVIKANADSMLPAGKVSDFVVGDYKKVTLSNGNVVYIEATKTGFRALSSACTHRGCTVNWISAQKLFKCPCHGGQYDQAGNNISGPPPSPLPVLGTKVEGGLVYVQQ